MMGMDLENLLPQKFCIVPFWLVGRPSAGVLLPQKFCIVPFWLVDRPSAGVLLPKNFVLFPSGLVAGLRPASSFHKILYCSLLACWPAFGRHPPSQKFCIVPFWSFLLACRPAFGWPPPSPKFGTGAKFFFVVSGKIASRTSLAAGGREPPAARSVRFAQKTLVFQFPFGPFCTTYS